MPTCLIIDDVEVTRYSAKVILEELGLDTVEAGDAKSAMAAINNKQVDVVLVDWHLRKESGLNIIKQLREHGNNVPVIVISGVEKADREGRANQAGANLFITKPTTEENLKSAMEKLGVL